MSILFANNSSTIIAPFHSFGIDTWTSNGKGMFATPVSFIWVLFEDDQMTTTPDLTDVDIDDYLMIIS